MKTKKEITDKIELLIETFVDGDKYAILPNAKLGSHELSGAIKVLKWVIE